MIILAIPLAAIVAIFAVTSALLKVFCSKRMRANEDFSRNLAIAFQKWNALLDAKIANDGDVPDSVFRLGDFMIQSINGRGAPMLLLFALANSARSSEQNQLADEGDWNNLREPLQEAFHDLIKAWVVCVSNRNLLIRPLIRQKIGRLVERNPVGSPFTTQVIRSAKRRRQTGLAQITLG